MRRAGAQASVYRGGGQERRGADSGQSYGTTTRAQPACDY